MLLVNFVKTDLYLRFTDRMRNTSVILKINNQKIRENGWCSCCKAEIMHHLKLFKKLSISFTFTTFLFWRRNQQQKFHFKKFSGFPETSKFPRNPPNSLLVWHRNLATIVKIKKPLLLNSIDKAHIPLSDNKIRHY